jgi:hypothetical protein
MKLHGELIKGECEERGVDSTNLFWELQSGLQDHSLSLKTHTCQKTNLVALFMKYLDSWQLCHDGVNMEDWSLLEVEGCDWISV